MGNQFQLVTNTYVSQRTEISGECIVWIGPKNKDGYGMFQPTPNCKKEHILMHRWAYWKHVSMEISSNDVIRHSCDNPACINPNHLIKGTHNDNVQDRVSRQRSAVGEVNGRSKLTEENVKEIKADINKGKLKTDIAKKFGITRRTVKFIEDGKIWKHLGL